MTTPQPPEASQTSRWSIAPGTVVLRRDEKTLQIGTTRPVVIDDAPGLRSALLKADGFLRTEDFLLTMVGHPDPKTLLAKLVAAGVLSDRSSRRRPRPPQISLVASPGVHEAADVLTAMLGDDVVLSDTTHSCDLAVLISRGEPHRGTIEALNSHRIAHVPLVFDGPYALVGPLSVPGTTPCLICHDTHRARWDPHWRALAAQFGCCTPRTSGTSRSVVLGASALIASEILASVEHRASELVGQRVLIGPRPDDRSADSFALDPGCTCCLLAA